MLTPVLFKANSWSIQADVTHLASKQKAGVAGVVLLMEGGGTVRIAVNELPWNKLQFSAICEPPILGWDKAQLAVVGGTVERMTRISISCADGVISIAGIFGAKVVALPGGKGAPAPMHMGVFTRSYQADEDVIFLYDNFKAAGIIDRDRVKDFKSQARAAVVAGAKAAQLSALQFRNELAGTLDKNWMTLWTADSQGQACPMRGDFNGRKAVMRAHPLDGNTPGKWLRRVKLEAGKKYALTYEASAHVNFDFATAVSVNGKQLQRNIIAGNSWKPIEVDLSDYAGSEINIEISCEAGNAYDVEFGYFDLIRIKEK
jgi:hypothetical protein